MAGAVEPEPRLSSTDPPPIFPLPAPTAPFMAHTKEFRFGWYAPNRKSDVMFVISRTTALGGDKTLHAYPLTEDGWAKAWAQMIKLSNDLATEMSAVVQRIDETRTRTAATEAWRKEREELGVIAAIPGCELLGGHGFDPQLKIGEQCDLYFTEEGLWVTRARLQKPWIRAPYSSSRALAFSKSGPRSGGLGAGGFAAIALTEGVIAAGLLSSLTARYSVQTIIRYQGLDFEAFFFCSTFTPDQLRIELSVPEGRIQAATASAGPAALTEPEDLTIRLQRLGELFRSGLLSQDEFSAAKAKLLDP